MTSMIKMKQKIHMLGLCAFLALSMSLFGSQQGTPSMSSKSTSLVLYYSPSCPYCHKVTRFMEENNITLEMKDVNKPGIRDELIKIGGKGQVPCLVHNGKALYESNEIITWLSENEENH
ncbi:MAG: hypothetical protein S4CHLAM7_11330 [Chlamydiae bacterium]|nr:hypothetical protein [Chlamydiota bacterium]